MSIGLRLFSRGSGPCRRFPALSQSELCGWNYENKSGYPNAFPRNNPWSKQDRTRLQRYGQIWAQNLPKHRPYKTRRRIGKYKSYPIDPKKATSPSPNSLAETNVGSVTTLTSPLQKPLSVRIYQLIKLPVECTLLFRDLNLNNANVICLTGQLWYQI